MNYEHSDVAAVEAPDPRVDLMHRFVDLQRAAADTTRRVEELSQKSDSVRKELAEVRESLHFAIDADQAKPMPMGGFLR